MSKTLESTRSYLTSQDTKTVQPDEIQNLIVARTAEKRKETPIVNTKRDFLKKYIVIFSFFFFLQLNLFKER